MGRGRAVGRRRREREALPGHGDTATDSHLALPVVDLPLERLRERELAPFRAAIAAGTRSIMTSHILLPQLDAEQPATLSSRILQRLLRGELGFEGVIVTDALDMAGASGVHGIPEAAVRALAAGCDLLCIGTDNTAPQMEEIVAAIARGRFGPASGRARDGCRARVARCAAGSGSGWAVRRRVVRVRACPSSCPPTSATGSPRRSTSPTARSRASGTRRIGTVVRIDTVANIAVGGVPWGPFALLAEPDPQRPAPAWLADAAIVAVDAGPRSRTRPGSPDPCSSWARTCTAIRSPSRRSRACAPRATTS